MINDEESYFLCGKKLTGEEVAEMREIAEEIAAADEFVNPLEKLAKEEEMGSMDETMKFRYLLDLSAIFVKMKNSVGR